MFSMTGYGKGEYKQGGIELTVEIKTVNNRYLDVSVKSPKIFNAYEEAVRALVREKLTRGHADLFINFVDKREKAKELYVDAAAAKGYFDAAQKLKAMFPALADDFTLTSLLKSPDVVRQEDVRARTKSSLRRCARLWAPHWTISTSCAKRKGKSWRRICSRAWTRWNAWWAP